MKKLILFFVLFSINISAFAQFRGPQPPNQRWLELCVHYVNEEEKFNPPRGLTGTLKGSPELFYHQASDKRLFEYAIKEEFAQICSGKIMLWQDNAGKELDVRLGEINFSADRRVTMMLLKQEAYVDNEDEYHYTPDSKVVEMIFNPHTLEYEGTVIVESISPGNRSAPVVRSNTR